MTVEDFRDFYPQFVLFRPEIVIQEFVKQANARFEDFQEDAEDARRLYVAHRLTLYARTVLPEGEQGESSMSAIAAAGGKQQEITAKKVGEVSVNYGNSASYGGAVSTAWADLTETTYGLQLLTLIRMHAFGKYIP